jgi:hypothetical protein
LLCFCLSISGQELYQKGFVLSSPLDTLHGEIKYISYNQAAAQCIFRDSTNKETVFLPQDVYGYGVADNLLFFSKELDDQGPIFLEVVYQGTLTLFSYRDINARNYYYVESNESGEFRALTQKTVGNNRRQKVFKTYIDVLKIMLPKSDLVADQIEGVSLSAKSLTRLLATYDERYANTLGITYKGIAGTSPPRLGILAGSIYSRLTLNGHQGDVNQQFFSVGIRLEKEVSRGTGRLFLNADLLITDESYRGEFAAQQVVTQDNDIVSNFINFALTADYVGVSGPIDYRTYAELSRTVISMPVNLKYKLPGRRFNVTFGGGIEVQYATSSDVLVDGRVFQDGMIAFRAFTQEFANPFRLGMNIGAGLAYNAKRTVFLDARFSPAWFDQGALNYRYMRLMLGVMLNKN